MKHVDRQRLGLAALLATFAVVAGSLAVSHAETVDSHARVTATLEFEGQVTSLRVWIQRSTNEVLAALLGLPETAPGLTEGDRTRARADVAAIRRFVTGQPEQEARVAELERLLDRRFQLEDAALLALRESGHEAAARVLGDGEWLDDRVRFRMITQALLSGAREDFLRGDAAHTATLRRARWALAAGLLLLLGTLFWLLRQLSIAQRGREELAAADARAKERLAELEGVLATV
ncbi:MAG TPA: hypothetical protein PLL32_00115, partial [Anaeromyxobacteraceae bacterium]|nr:hypothetical protein [Anaeromyxobacteraceae bacterium]